MEANLKPTSTTLHFDPKTESFAGMLGTSRPMLEIFSLIERVSEATANVLISGESGTGKENVARAIHQCGSRSRYPFVAVNCTAIPEPLMESELFGHAKGAFTGAWTRSKGLFEEADGGTLFLDEIGDMDLSLQAKLLRVLQDKKVRAVGEVANRPVNIRIISATNKDLRLSVKSGSFREDLYYRLNVIPIRVPPLRQRREDIPILSREFLKRFSAANGSIARGFTEGAIKKLKDMPWQGNVRELENCIERAVVLCRDPLISENDIPITLETASDLIFANISESLPTVEEFEKRYIQFVLSCTGGKKDKAAQILGMNRRTLYRKERVYGFVGQRDFPPEKLDV